MGATAVQGPDSLCQAARAIVLRGAGRGEAEAGVAFFVSPTTALTVAHNLQVDAAGGSARRHLTRVTCVRPGDDARFSFEVVALDADLDFAVLRLRAGGYSVLLDDIILGDERERFFHLPFIGFKLDRSLVMSLPEDARARREVLRLTRAAHRRGQHVIAEGVSDLRLWAATRGLGIDHAQGFIVGRPLPAEALSAWWSSWRSRQPA